MGGVSSPIYGRPARRGTGRLSVLLAGMLLLVQFAAAVHSHGSSDPRSVSSTSGQSATEAPCGLCQFIRHSNSASSHVLQLYHSRLAVACIVEPRFVTPCSSTLALPTERGPPAAA